MSNGELPEGFFGWVLTGIGGMLATLVTTVATLWRVSESKNAKAIEGWEKKIVVVEAELKAEVKTVREKLETTEIARLECEQDRSSLSAKCEIFEHRLQRLEKQA